MLPAVDYRLLARLHSALIQSFESRFEFVIKANTESIQRVDPHKFSSIELNPHFVSRTPGCHGDHDVNIEFELDRAAVRGILRSCDPIERRIRQ